MHREEQRRRSRWLMRAMEWDDRKARYPNIWFEGMPSHILAFDTMAGRLRLGDLIAVYHPMSSCHPERSDRIVGIATVTGLRRADAAGQAWIDLEAAHRFDPPLNLGRQPRRVFMCCDPDWPDSEVDLFNQVYAAAVSAGWNPPADEPTAPTTAESSADTGQGDSDEPPTASDSQTPVDSREETRNDPAPINLETTPDVRLFAGSDIGGEMRDPRDGTWLAVVALVGDRLQLVRLDAKGRSGIQASLRDPDRDLMRAEAVGLGFPFGLPEPFAESLMGRGFTEEGWWALAKRLEKLTWPAYLRALADFRESRGDLKRVTDEELGACSPLQRDKPDMGSKGYHGIRMIAEDRSRFAIRPFETAQGKLLLEVFPDGALRLITPAPNHVGGSCPTGRIVDALYGLDSWPLDMAGPFRKQCRRAQQAMKAVIAARCAAVAVLNGEADRDPDDLAPGLGSRVRREGWVYGLRPSA